MREMSNRNRWTAYRRFRRGDGVDGGRVRLYLRTLVGRLEPYQPNPLPIRGTLGEVELWREAATLLMLAMTGMLARPNVASATGLRSDRLRLLGHSLLRLPAHHLGWPASVFDWDILFLLPLPWWGPVLAPVCIASLMIVWGTLSPNGTTASARRVSRGPRGE